MAKVPKSSGQGVSRGSYQSGWRSGQRGTGAPGASGFKPLRGETGGQASGARSYGKDGYQAPKNQPFTTEPASDLVPFGVSNLKALENFPGAKPKKGLL